jgi:uncharacterized protein (DUF2384 family)
VVITDKGILEANVATSTQFVAVPLSERLARCVLRTVDVMGSTAAAERWLSQPLAALNGNTPLSLLAGADFTKFDDLLSSIEYGIFA